MENILKRTELLKLLSILLLFISCSEDPITSSDDKLIRTLNNYDIVYTTLQCDEELTDVCWKINRYNFEKMEGEVIYNEASLLSPLYNGKGFLINESEDNDTIFLYDFYDLKRISIFNNPLIGFKYIPRFVNKEIVAITNRFRNFSDVKLTTISGEDIINIDKDVLWNSIYYLNDFEKILYRKSNRWIMSDIDGNAKVENFIDNDKYTVVDKYNKASKLLLLGIGNQDKEFYEYDIEKEEEKLLFKADSEVYIADLSPDNSKIAIMDVYSNIFLYDLKSNTLETVYNKSNFKRLPIAGLISFQWSSDSKFLLFIESDFNKSKGKLGVIVSDKNEFIILSNTSDVISAYWMDR